MTDEHIEVISSKEELIIANQRKALEALWEVTSDIANIVNATPCSVHEFFTEDDPNNVNAYLDCDTLDDFIKAVTEKNPD